MSKTGCCLTCRKVIALDKSLFDHVPENERIKQLDLCSRLSTCSILTGAVRFDSSEVFASVQFDRANSGLDSCMTVMARMLDIIASDSTAAEHPLCQSCADRLMDCLDQSLLRAEEDCREYKRILDKLETADEQLSNSKLEKELVSLQEEENSLKEELAYVEQLRNDIDMQIEKEQENVELVIEREKDLWRTYRDYRRKVLDLDLEIQGTKNHLSHSTTLLNKLIRSNVFDLTFHIWHSGQFGTINGFRLGHLPNHNVDWSEVNAALGQTVLLLYSLLKKVGLDLKGYQLVPFGSYSYIRSLRDGKELRLFTEGGAKFTWHPKFDHAIVAFVDCLHQLEEHIRLRVGGDYNLPYRMRDDKIEDGGTDYSVKTHLNSEERWTKAMKCMLTNLKWALAWVASLG
ncbi:beclin 1 [Trichuris trichiura]|uniref:Beclin 1 n=1 Tax=Trichuris trichiura TaxID=36087 RepID=A0A077ZFH6_TRITR|nr:beclin 1 [Trichuris trichiura]